MKANVGGWDRAIRMIMGAALILLGIFAVQSSGWMIALIGLGALLFLTGSLRFCALYLICGANTCPGGVSSPK